MSKIQLDMYIYIFFFFFFFERERNAVRRILPGMGMGTDTYGCVYLAMSMRIMIYL